MLFERVVRRHAFTFGLPTGQQSPLFDGGRLSEDVVRRAKYDRTATDCPTVPGNKREARRCRCRSPATRLLVKAASRNHRRLARTTEAAPVRRTVRENSPFSRHSHTPNLAPGRGLRPGRVA